MKNAAALFAALLALPLLASPPRIAGGSLTTVRAGDVISQLRAADGWVGYDLPLAEERSVWCNDETFSMSRDDDSHPRLHEIALFFHVRDGEVDNVRVSSRDCAFDAKGDRVTWIENAGERAALDALIDVARHAPDRQVRGKALLWLGIQAGDRAARALREAVDNDPETKVKARAVLGIAQLPDDQSIPMLVELMNTHRSREVRRKAAFWLGQKDDPRAVDALEKVLLQR